MPYRKCEICDIKSERKDGSKRYFMARFPLDELRCKEWVKVTGKEDLAYLPIEKLNQLKFICGNHFKKRDFTKKGIKLKKSAIPSIRLTSEPLSDTLLAGFPCRLFYEQQSLQEDEPSTSMSVVHSLSIHGPLPCDRPLSSVPSQKEIAIVEEADRIFHEDDIPPVEYTVDLVIRDEPSTSMSVVHSLSIHGPLPCDRPLSSVPSQKEIAIVEEADRIFHEDDIPPVEYTVDLVIRDDVATSSILDPGSVKSIEHTTEQKGIDDVPTSLILDSGSIKSIEQKGVRKRRKRANILSSKEDLTPRKKKLVKKVEHLKSKIRKIKKTAKMFNNIQSKALKTMMFSAIKNQNRSSQGKRWSDNEKALAIAMYKKSPKLYRYLRHLLPLPSPRTLQIVLSKMPINPGFNKSIIDHLKRKVRELSCKDKTCVILFDEMSLKKRLIFNSANDKVEGYQDLGEHGRSGDLADKALVFLLQGVHQKFKQPLAHYFVKGTISSEKLVAIIKNATKIVSEIGFKVIATVCDQGPTNVGALNLLKKFSGQPLDSNYYIVDSEKVYIIYDVPHLFKSIRNNFFEGGVLVFDGMKARWSHLVEFQEKNNKTLHFKKITPLHVNPKFRAKMKVKLAAQILSNDVSGILKLFSETFEVNLKEDDETLKRDAVLQTANVIQQLDTLFDITNGPASKKDVKRGLRVNVSKNSIHHELWPEFKQKIKTMYFLKSDSQLRLRNVRCVNGYYTTICSLQDIWKYVQSIGFKFLNLRQLNQDSLENLFGLIRQHSPTNQNPTCHHFTAALKTSILTKLSTPIRGANCDPDDNQLMLDFHDLVFTNREAEDLIDVEHSYPGPSDKDQYVCDSDHPILHLPDIDPDEEDNLFELFDKQPVVYVSGYLASVLIKGTNCSKCCDSIRTLEPGNDKMYDYIALREWWKDKLSLTYPTLNLCNTVNLCVSVFERDIKHLLYNNDIVKYCCVLMYREVNLTWMCKEHNGILMDALLTKLSVLLIRNECKKINMSITEREQSNADINKIAQLTSSAR